MIERAARGWFLVFGFSTKQTNNCNAATTQVVGDMPA